MVYIERSAIEIQFLSKENVYHTNISLIYTPYLIVINKEECGLSYINCTILHICLVDNKSCVYVCV